MAYADVTEIADGVKTHWSLPFTYLLREFVRVTVTDPDGTETSPVFVFEDDYTISLIPAVVAGSKVRRWRSTKLSAPLVDYQNKAVVTEEDLDTSNLQAVHLAQEFNDKLEDVSRVTLDAVGNAEQINAETKELLAHLTNVPTDLARVEAELLRLSSSKLGNSGAQTLNGSLAATGSITAATPATGAKGTEVVTAAWVKAQGYTTDPSGASTEYVPVSGGVTMTGALAVELADGKTRPVAFSGIAHTAVDGDSGVACMVGTKVLYHDNTVAQSWQAGAAYAYNNSLNGYVIYDVNNQELGLEINHGGTTVHRALTLHKFPNGDWKIEPTADAPYGLDISRVGSVGDSTINVNTPIRLTGAPQVDALPDQCVTSAKWVRDHVASRSLSYADLSDKPTLGTAAAKDVAATGNASADQVVLGNDTRLSDARTPIPHTHSDKADLIDGKVPAAQLPSYVDDVIEVENYAALPPTGEAGKIYVSMATNLAYRWSGTGYLEISPAPSSTDSVAEGSSNLYFTAQRVRDAVLAGLTTAANAAISASDTVLAALGKLQAQISGKADAAHTHQASQITDATSTGRVLMTAADAAAVRSTAGLSNHEKVSVDAGGNMSAAGSGTFGGSLNVGQFQINYDKINNPLLDSDEAGVVINHTGYSGGTTRFRDFYVYDGKTNPLFRLTGATKQADFWGNLNVIGSGSFGGNILPATDNTLTCGTAPNRWKEVFAGNNVINTSDARVKTAPRKMTDAEIAAAADLAENIGIFQYLDAVAEKGEAAREHAGMTVQSAIAIMEAHGLDPHRYGFICHDEWDELTEEVEDPAGDIVRVTERQVTRTEQQDYSEIKIIGGVPTLITGMRDVQVPVTKMVAVVDASGEAVLDGEGKPRTHPVPVMEKVETRYRRKVTREAGDLYSFRTEQLNLLIARGLAALWRQSPPAASASGTEV